MRQLFIPGGITRILTLMRNRDCPQDWLLMEEEFVANQERLKPQEERNQADRDKASRPP